MERLFTSHTFVLSLCLWIFSVASVTVAVTSDWSTNASGNFNSPGNWDNGVPSSSDSATFNRGSGVTYTVTFPGDFPLNPLVNYVNDRLIVDSNNVSLIDSPNHLLFTSASYTLNNPTTAAIGQGIVVGSIASDTAAVLNTNLVNLTAVAAVVGSHANSNGTLNVTGGNLNITGSSNVAGDAELFIGGSGAGTLNVLSGGHVNVSGDAGDVTISSSFSGALNISGVGSTMTVGGVNSEFIVENFGNGTLMISAGGQLTTSGTASIAASTGTGISQGTATVDGAGSKWTAGMLTINDFPDNHGSLNVTDGGQVVSTSGTGAGHIFVDGIGSLWNTGAMSASQLSVTAGGQVIDTTANFNAGYPGTKLFTVDGLGSKWTTSGALIVGNGDSKVIVTNGGQVSSTDGSIDSDGNATKVSKISIDGAGSLWSNSAALTVGIGGAAVLSMTLGGQVSTASSMVGQNLGSNGMVTVDGSGSKFTNSGELHIGEAGAGSLAITGGAKAASDSGFVGVATGGNGVVTVDGGGSTWTTSGALYIGQAGTGALTITGGAQVAAGNGFVGEVPGGSGTVIVEGISSTCTMSGDLKIGDAGTATLTARAGGTVSVSGIATIGPHGTLDGDGIIAAATVQNGGVVSPGNSSGALHVIGDYSQISAGKLQIGLNGTVAGTSYDQLSVTGTMTLDGLLDVSVGYSPHAGDTFDILNWGARNGVFAALHLPTLSGLRWNISNLYTAGILSLVAVLPGDFDEDGFVTGVDYTLWRAGFGITNATTHLQGDANGDGRVDAADYVVWRDELGQSVVGASSEITAVPEPTTLALFLTGILTLWYFRTRH